MGAGVSALERARRELAALEPEARRQVLEANGGLDPGQAQAVSSAAGLWGPGARISGTSEVLDHADMLRCRGVDDEAQGKLGALAARIGADPPRQQQHHQSQQQSYQQQQQLQQQKQYQQQQQQQQQQYQQQGQRQRHSNQATLGASMMDDPIYDGGGATFMGHDNGGGAIGQTMGTSNATMVSTGYSNAQTLGFALSGQQDPSSSLAQAAQSGVQSTLGQTSLFRGGGHGGLGGGAVEWRVGAASNQQQMQPDALSFEVTAGGVGGFPSYTPDYDDDGFGGSSYPQQQQQQERQATANGGRGSSQQSIATPVAKHAVASSSATTPGTLRQQLHSNASAAAADPDDRGGNGTGMNFAATFTPSDVLSTPPRGGHGGGGQQGHGGPPSAAALRAASALSPPYGSGNGNGGANNGGGNGGNGRAVALTPLAFGSPGGSSFSGGGGGGGYGMTSESVDFGGGGGGGGGNAGATRPATAKDQMLDRRRRQQEAEDELYRLKVSESPELLRMRSASKQVAIEGRRRGQGSTAGNSSVAAIGSSNVSSLSGPALSTGMNDRGVQGESKEGREYREAGRDFQRGGQAAQGAGESKGGDDLIDRDRRQRPVGDPRLWGGGSGERSSSEPTHGPQQQQQQQQQQQSRVSRESTARAGVRGGGGVHGGGGGGSGSGQASEVSVPLAGLWRLSEKKELGSGSFGQVFLGLNTATGEMIAVKRLQVPTDQISEGATTDGAESDGASGVKWSEVKREIELMASLHHPNIVRYLGAELDRKPGRGSTSLLYVLQEWVPGGSLGGLVKAFGPLEPAVTRRYARGIAKGLAFLHAQAVAHRDLKPDNVLIDVLGVAKIADFGASRRLASAAAGTAGEGQWSLKGTPFYMAPEQMKQEECGRKADVWALGGVLLFAATGEFPWKSCSGFENASKLNAFAFFFKVLDDATATPLRGLPPKLVSVLSATSATPPQPASSSSSSSSSAATQSPVPPLLPLLVACFQRDPNDRLASAELLAHPYIG